MHVDASDYGADAVLLQESEQKMTIQLVNFHISLTLPDIIIQLVKKRHKLCPSLTLL